MSKIERPQSKSPLPKDAQLVFKGHAFSVWQWEQRLFDGSTTIFEKVERPDATTVVPVTKNGQIIITHQKQPNRYDFIGFAGGVIEPGEDPVQSAERELLEETGYAAQSIELWYAEQPYARMEFAKFVFIAHGCEKVADQRLDAGEKIDLELVSFDQLLAVAKRNELRDIDISFRLLQAASDANLLENLKDQLFH